MRHLSVKIARIVALCASSIVVFGVLTEVRAGTLPNISGGWYAGGDGSKHCHINQSGSSVSLTNERGATATGSFVDPSSLTTNWGPFGGGQITGHISNDLRTITWSNGTYWKRSGAVSYGSVSSGSVSSGSAPVAVATPKPYRYLDWTKVEGPRAPIEFVDGWAVVNRNGRGAFACVSFKNTSSVTATQIRFDFPLFDGRKDVVGTAHLDRKGTFSPNVEIHGWHSAAAWVDGQGHRGYYDNCVVRSVSEEERLAYSHLHYYSIRIERIDYADGTTWPNP